MSTKSEQLEGELEGTGDEVCACCGIAGVDNVKLKKCACNLVKYCSDNCQNNHRDLHEEECKNRLAELRDRDLFTQPDESNMGECPICCLPLSIDVTKSTMMGCCSKIICRGCDYANRKREMDEGVEKRCPFCREPIPKSEGKALKKVMGRIKKNNDPAAMCRMGKQYDHQRDYRKALQYYKKAAELGYVDAHASLGNLYYKGLGVQKDEKKALYHLEKAAIRGHPQARYYLAVLEKRNGRFERAAKHFIIAANLGYDRALKCIKDLFVQRIVSKEEYAAALRGYQAAVDATKSAEREKAEAYYARMRS